MTSLHTEREDDNVDSSSRNLPQQGSYMQLQIPSQGNRTSGVVCQNLVTYRVGCTSNGRSHRENLKTIACSVVELF